MPAQATPGREGRPFWKEAYLACCLALLGIVCTIYGALVYRQFAMPKDVIWVELGLAVALVILIVVSMLRKKSSYMWWEAMMLLLGMGGIWIASLIALPLWVAILFACFVLISNYIWKMTAWNDFALLFGSAGIGFMVADHFPFAVLFLCVACTAFYEALRNRNMGLATLFSEAWQAGLVPGVLLPASTVGWLKNSLQVWSPGQGMVVSLLPFMAIAAVGFKLTVYGWPYVILLFVALIGAYFLPLKTKNQDPAFWVYPAIATVIYGVSGIIKIFI